MKPVGIAMFVCLALGLPVRPQVKSVEPALIVEGVAGRDKVVKGTLVLSLGDLRAMQHTSERIRYRVVFSLPEIDPAFTAGRIIVAD